jgi:hypothetical protein
VHRATLVILVACASLSAATSAGGAAPPFRASVSHLTSAELPDSYRAGCPVGPADLRLLHIPYIGFDGRPHHGALVVNVAVVTSVEHVFAQLYAERFPIRRMEPIDAFQGNDTRSMAADNTSGFNCRPAVASGVKHWSEHAFGEAIDVNPLENPYVFDGAYLPPAGRRFADRSLTRPGMAVPGGALVRAFASVGWGWGGAWVGAPDYQHFSINGH